MLPKIEFQVIPHKDQRYETVGDYFRTRDGVIHFRVSDMHNPAYEFAVFIHELTEWFFCRLVGITIEEIDEFDMKFEADRLLKRHSPTEEPGNHPAAPYRLQHRFATKIERQIIKAAGARWDIYGEVVENL